MEFGSEDSVVELDLGHVARIAGNLPLYSLKEMLGVGRGRRIGVLTFYQDIPQIYAMFGQEEGGAVLDMYGAKILLPGDCSRHHDTLLHRRFSPPTI